MNQHNNDRAPQDTDRPQSKGRRQAKRLGGTVLILLVLVGFCYVLYNSSSQNSQMQYSEVVAQFEQENVRYFKVAGTHLTLELYEPYQNRSTWLYNLYDVDLFRSDLGALIEEQYNNQILTGYDYRKGFASGWTVFIPLLFLILMLGGLWYMLSMQRSPSGAQMERSAQFGRARTHEGISGGKPITFDDVAGAKEEKEELQEIVSFLRDSEKYLALGARIPKGVLLVGPPGTGKTLLAKAVAGESNSSFLTISGSDFVEMYVGVGASRVRDLFRQAKEKAPAIIFIDEIDAVGRQRGTGLGGGHDEREQTLNQLLVEMDGFGSNEGVVVIAATNRKDVLDPALLRPGRFDRQVYVGLPDVKGREEILRVHAQGKALSEEVDLNEIARSTPGFSGADLENLTNEAALLAARRDERFIRPQEMHEAMLKVIAGPEKKSHIIPEKERRLTAYHEAGHAIVMHALENCDPVHQITIIPRGGAGGLTISLPSEERRFLSRSFLRDEIAALLGGRTAEKLILGDISTGASNDIERATSMARKMVTVYGMSDKIGTICLETGPGEVFLGRSMGQSRAYSEKLAAEIDEETRAIIDEGASRCEAILQENVDKLHIVASYLLEHEIMEAEEFEAVFAS
jgi:cell division protease FtsH